MKAIFNKYSKKDAIMLICFGVFLSVIIIHAQCCLAPLNKYVNLILKIIKYSFCVVFCVDFAIDFFQKRRTINTFMLVLSLTAIFVFIFNRSTSLIVFTLMIVEMGKYDFKDIVKTSYYFILSTYMIIILSSVLNIIPNLIYGRGQDIVRNSLGFTYPTIAATLLTYIILMKYYLKGFKVSYSTLSIDLLLSGCIYYLTDSRTGFLLNLIIIGFTFLIKIPSLQKINFEKIFQHKATKITLITIPTALLIVWLLLTFMYSKGVGLALGLDKLLSGRLYYSAKAFQENILTLFGANIRLNGWGGYGYYVDTENFVYNFLDNSYMNILFTQGIIPLLIVVFIYTYIIKNTLKLKDYFLLFVVGLVLLNIMIEPNAIDFSFNVFIFAATPLFYKKPKPEENRISDKTVI